MECIHSYGNHSDEGPKAVICYTDLNKEIRVDISCWEWFDYHYKNREIVFLGSIDFQKEEIRSFEDLKEYAEREDSILEFGQMVSSYIPNDHPLKNDMVSSAMQKFCELTEKMPLAV